MSDETNLRDAMLSLTGEVSGLRKDVLVLRQFVDGQTHRIPPIVQLSDRRTYDGYVLITVTDGERKSLNNRVQHDIVGDAVEVLWHNGWVRITAILGLLATIGGFAYDVARAAGWLK